MLGLQISSASRRCYEVFWHTSGAVWSFGLAECLACKLVVQAVQSWSSALLRACTGWGSPLGGPHGVLCGALAFERCSLVVRPCCVLGLQIGSASGAVMVFGLAACLCRLGLPPMATSSFAPLCVGGRVCVCVVCLCVCVVCGRPDTSGCWGSCWVLMCLRACHPAVAPVACEVWGLDRAGCCRVVLVCVCRVWGKH